MWRRWIRSEFFRALAVSVLAAAVSLPLVPLLTNAAGVEDPDSVQSLITTFVVFWPAYVWLYLAYSIVLYKRLSFSELVELAAAESRSTSGLVQRLAGSGTGNVLTMAAGMAVVVTVVIAQRPEFRSEPAFIALGLLTVASSWVLMAFTFAQAYLRLDIGTERGSHLRFSFTGNPEFNDYLTQGLMVSMMAVAAPAEALSRPAWRLVRTNTLVAFAFNSVIIAMMVSLLFGGISSG